MNTATDGALALAIAQFAPTSDRAANLARIAEAAGVTLDWLATGRGPKRRELQPIGNVEESSDDNC